MTPQGRFKRGHISAGATLLLCPCPHSLAVLCPPHSPGSILQQPGEVTGAIPQLCVTCSNDTLRSLSSQGLPGGPSPVTLLIIPSRMGCGRAWGSRVVTQEAPESGSAVTPLMPCSGCSQCPSCQIQPCCGQHRENTSLDNCSHRSSRWHCPRDSEQWRHLWDGL